MSRNWTKTHLMRLCRPTRCGLLPLPSQSYCTIILSWTNQFDLVDMRNQPTQVFVMFYSPSCPHCVKLKPDWDHAARTLSNMGIMARIDCTQSGADNVCAQRGVTGYPSIRYFENGKNIEYTGSREAGELVEFMRRMERPLVQVVANEQHVRASVSACQCIYFRSNRVCIH
jgi:thioredoxin-like negative regulator of GroEL